MESQVFQLFERHPVLQGCRQPLEDCRDRLIAAFRQGHTLFVAGNGGSAADAEHIVGELLKGFLRPRPLAAPLAEQLVQQFAGEGQYLATRLQQGLPAVALTGHPALATAVTNDLAGDLIYAQQLLALGRPGDVFLGISTSGKAANVCHAARIARVRGITSMALTGRGGGPLAELCEVAIRVPAAETALVQELHLPVYHWLCASIENYFFP